MKQIAFLILFVLLWGIGFTQDQRTKDSLRNVIQTTTVDTARVMALARLSFIESQPSLRLELAFKALHLSKQIKWKAGEAGAYVQLSNCYRNISDYPNALDNALKCLKKYEEIGDPKGIGAALSVVGSVYLAQERYQEALIYFSRTEKVYSKVPSVSADRKGLLHSQFGRAYVMKGRYDSALIYLNRAYEIMPKNEP